MQENHVLISSARSAHLSDHKLWLPYWAFLFFPFRMVLLSFDDNGCFSPTNLLRLQNHKNMLLTRFAIYCGLRSHISIGSRLRMTPSRRTSLFPSLKKWTLFYLLLSDASQPVLPADIASPPRQAPASSHSHYFPLDLDSIGNSITKMFLMF